MYTGLYSAVSGGMAQEKRLAILTNNLANATTVGFKGEKPIFQVLPLPIVVGDVQFPDAPGPITAPVDPMLSASSPQSHIQMTITDFSQGPLHQTGNTLDLALEGNGFFVVEGSEGDVYTRQGTFTINAEGLMVTQDGLVVQGEGGPLSIDGSHVEIDTTGRVLVDGEFRDRLKLVDFPQPYALEKMGDSFFRSVVPEQPAQEATGLVVHQGAVELSNSQPIRLLGAVTQTSRAYEAYQKVIQVYDQMAARAVNDIAST